MQIVSAAMKAVAEIRCTFVRHLMLFGTLFCLAMASCLPNGQWSKILGEDSTPPSEGPVTPSTPVVDPLRPVPTDAENGGSGLVTTQPGTDATHLDTVSTDSTSVIRPSGDVTNPARVEVSDLTDERQGENAADQFSEPSYPVDEGFVRARIALYEGKLQQWNEMAGQIVQLDHGNTWPAGWYECVQQTEMLIVGYRGILEGSQVGSHGMVLDSDGPWPIFVKDIGYVEGGCESVYLKGKGAIAEKVSGGSAQVLQEAVGVMRNYFELGKFAEAAATYEAQAGVAGELSKERGVQVLYVDALLRAGRLDDAVMVMEKRYDPENSVVNTQLLANAVRYADLLVAAGHYQRAAKVYDRLKTDLGALGEREEWVFDQAAIIQGGSQELLAAYSTLLRLYQASDRTYVPAEMYQAYSVIEKGNLPATLRSARRLIHDLEDTVDAEAEKQLVLARELFNDQGFAEARRVLQQLSANESEVVRQKADALLVEVNEAQRADVLNQKQLEQQKVSGQWEHAIHLFEVKEYNAAIAELTLLLNTKYSDEAQAKIAEASDLAANEMRRQAAGLFVQARKAGGVASKVDLFNQSKALLVELLKRYPEAEIVGKVQQNIQVLDDELAKIQLPSQTGASAVEATSPVLERE